MNNINKIAFSRNGALNKDLKEISNNDLFSSTSKTSNELLTNKRKLNIKNLNNKKNNLKDSSSQGTLLLSAEKESIERKKIKKEIKHVEKRYIVDDIDNIYVLLKEPKFKLRIQEFLHFFIVFLVCIYYWIFLFITGEKIERSYYLTGNEQFDVCSEEQICNFAENSANVIIYNHSFNYNKIPSDAKELFAEESNIMNSYYRSFFVRFSVFLTRYKLTSVTHNDYINEKPMITVVITNKEKWDLFYRYFSLCEYNNYYFAMIAMIAIGGTFGSFLFGFLSDINGRRFIIIITLLLSTIGTFGIYILSLFLDIYYEKQLDYFKERCLSNTFYCDINIWPYFYAQEKTRDKFKDLFIYLLICIFLLNMALWPLLKSCMALLLENSKGELEVLINFRRYNVMFQGLPPLCTSLIFISVNNFTLTFLILSIVNILTLILSIIFLDESIRYYYEYGEWENLTKVLLNTYKINLNDFRTLNEAQFKEFQKNENSKSFLNFDKYKYDNSSFKMEGTYYKHYIEAAATLKRNIKRNVDFVIKLDDIKSYPLLIVTTLWANHALKNSKTLLFIILILLYINMDLFQKELLEPPFFSMKDFYFGKGFNYIINSIFFFYLLVNVLSNYFYYCFYRIECFKTIIYISQVFISLNFLIYHILITNPNKTPMDINEYNFGMLYYFFNSLRTNANLFFLFAIYFALNGVLFYEYLLIVKISQTIHRCSFFSLHSLALIIALVVSEFIYYYMEYYFLFLSVVNLLCLITFAFLSDFNELIYIINDLKISKYGIRTCNNKVKFKKN